MLTAHLRRAALRAPRALPRAFSTISDPHVAGSPFEPLDLSQPNPPLADFITQDWATFGDRVAITDGITGDTRTFEELHRDVASVAGGMRDMGIARGSVVGVQSPNHVDYGTVVLAAARLGAAITPVNPLYTKYELAHQLRGSGATVMITHPMCYDVVTSDEANDGADVREVLVLGGDAPAGATALDTLKGRAAGDGVDATVTGVAGDDLVVLPFSSGTTGLPKGTMVTHDNLVTNLRQFVAPEFRFVGAGDAIISPLPMFHIYGPLME